MVVSVHDGIWYLLSWRSDVVRFDSDKPDPCFVDDSVNVLPDQASKWWLILMNIGTLPLPKGFFSNDGFMLIES